MYKGLSTLSVAPSFNKPTLVKLVLYTIDNTFAIPFLKFHLVKDCKEDLNDIKDISLLEERIKSSEYLTFPSFTYDPSSFHLFTLYCQGVAESLFEGVTYISRIEPSGNLYDLKSDVCYSFFKITETTTEAEYLNRDVFVWQVLIDEIINTKRVCNIPIDPFVTSFFSEHNEFVYLYDDSNLEMSTDPIMYEYPVVVYGAVPKKKLEFNAMFGITKNNDTNYKLSSYETEIQDYIRNENKPNVFGLLRCVLYVENMTLFQERFNDEDISTWYMDGTYYFKNYIQHKPISYHCVYKTNNYNT
jgi:hypothetical protein